MSVCGGCRFYHDELEHEGKKYGFCFRYPPVALAETRSSVPVVRREMRSCGEFKPKARAKVRARGRK